MSDRENQGWWWPDNSKKRHYFVQGRSLCLKWGKINGAALGEESSDHDCKECTKRLEKWKGPKP